MYTKVNENSKTHKNSSYLKRDKLQINFTANSTKIESKILLVIKFPWIPDKKT